MDVYRIGVSIVLTNSLTPALTAITSQLMGANNAALLLNANLQRLKLAAAGITSVFAGVKIFEGLMAMAHHGADVNHQLEMMKIAGMKNQEIQEALGSAMKVTGSNMTTTLSENLQHIRELRYAFGDVGVAMQHLDEISKANTILNTIKGGGKDQVWELVKSLEQKGLTFNPAEFSSYVNTMTKVTEATGGKVTPAQFQGTFKYGRTSMLGWDENFVGGALPRLIQSMTAGGGGSGGSGGPGNALMTGFRQIVSGVMSKPAAEMFRDLGFASMVPAHGTTKAYTKVNDDLVKTMISNPYEAIQKMMPAIMAKYGKDQNKLIQILGTMFPTRTFGSVASEMALQGRVFEGENSPFEKDMKIQRGAMDQAPSFNEIAKNDYPTVMKELTQQFKTLMEVFGSPMVAPGGPVLTAMTALSSAMNSIAQFAGAHPQGLKYALEALAALAGGLVVGGLVAILGAIAGVVGVGGAIAGAAAGLAALAVIHWEDMKKLGTVAYDFMLAISKIMLFDFSPLAGIGDKITSALKSAVDMVVSAVPGIFASIGSAIVNALKGAIGGIGGRIGNGGGADQQHQKDLGGGFAPMNYRAAPPGRGGSGMHTAVLQIDRRTIGQVMLSEISRRGSGPIEGSVYPDSTRMAARNDTTYVS